MPEDGRWYAIRVIDHSTALLRYHELIRMALAQYDRYDPENLQETVQLLLESYMSLAEPAIKDLKESLTALDDFSMNQVRLGQQSATNGRSTDSCSPVPPDLGSGGSQ